MLGAANPNQENLVVRYGREHLSLAVTGIILAVVFTKLFVISRANPQTFLGLVKEAGPVEVVFGTLMISMPTLAMSAGFYATVKAIESVNTRRSHLEYLTTALLLTLALLFLLPWHFTVLLLVPYALFIPFFTLRMRRQLRRIGDLLSRGLPSDEEMTELAGLGAVQIRLRKFTTRIMGPFVVLSVILVLLIDSPWMPSEELEMIGGESHVGYVITTTADEALVLNDSTRLLEWIRLDSIESRSICWNNNNAKPALRVWDSPNYPDCP